MQRNRRRSNTMRPTTPKNMTLIWTDPCIKNFGPIWRSSSPKSKRWRRERRVWRLAETKNHFLAGQPHQLTSVGWRPQALQTLAHQPHRRWVEELINCQIYLKERTPSKLKLEIHSPNNMPKSMMLLLRQGRNSTPSSMNILTNRSNSIISEIKLISKPAMSLDRRGICSRPKSKLW